MPSLLKSILGVSPDAQKNPKTLDELPQDVMTELQRNIKKGAKDLDQLWSNALELVHKAYDVSAVQRPTPDMKAAWKQYEENIAVAVDALSKARGRNSQWRMSEREYVVEVYTNNECVGRHVVLAESVEDLLNRFAEPGLHMETAHVTGGTKVSFMKWCVKQPNSVIIRQKTR